MATTFGSKRIQAAVGAAVVAAAIAGCAAIGIDPGTLGARASLQVDPGTQPQFPVARPTGGLITIDEGGHEYLPGMYDVVKCGEDAQGSYDDCGMITGYHTSLKVRATPKPGYRFGGWTSQAWTDLSSDKARLCAPEVNPCTTTYLTTLSLGAAFHAVESTVGDPAAVRVDGATHIFARTADNQLYHRLNDRATGPGERLGGVLSSGTAAASWGSGRIDAFARGSDGALFQRWSEGGAWRDWVRLTTSNTIGSDPVAVSWGPNRVDVFARGANGGIMQVYWDGDSWKQFDGLAEGRDVPYGLAVSSRGVGKLDLFYRGGDNALYHRAYDNGWQPWQRIGNVGMILSDPDAASWDSNRIDVFARGYNNALFQYWYENGVWHPAVDLGGNLTSGTAVVTKGKPTLDVYARSADFGGQLARKSYDGQSWLPWTLIPS